jgi:hypothetical protein
MLAPVIGAVVAFTMAAYYWYKFKQVSEEPQRFRTSVPFVLLRTILPAMLRRLGGLNIWIASRFKTTRERVVQVELGGLLAFGFTMMQIGEWAAAVACWILFGCILFWKVMSWRSGGQEQWIIKLLKSVGAVLIIGVCGVLIAITDLRKPDQEPWSNLQKWNWPGHQPPCSVSVSVTSEIVARVHLRAKWLPSGSTGVYAPIFQDLFHEWVINVTLTRTVPEIVVDIQDARKPTDKIRIEPSGNNITSEPKPGWMSGFDEPTQAPDFYVRSVTFSALGKPTVITIRRPIKSSQIGLNSITSLDLDLDRQVRASAEQCKVMLTPVSTSHSPLSADNPHFQYLIDQLRALLAERVSGKEGTVTRLDPDAPYPPLEVNGSELVEELRCTNSPCTRMLVAMKERTRRN